MLFLAESEDASSFEMQSHIHLKDSPYANTLIDNAEGEKRWPQFSWQKVQVGLHNPLGGWIEATAAVELLRKGAEQNGALFHQADVLQVEEKGAHIRLLTKEATHQFDKTVVAAGPWVQKLLPSLNDHCEVTRQQVCFFKPPKPDVFASPAFPVWAYDIEHRGWYGFPINQEGVLKLASHSACRTVEDPISS